jgi:hypothetical protein
MLSDYSTDIMFEIKRDDGLPFEHVSANGP